MKTTEGSEKTLTSRERVRKHRQSLRASGFRPIQLWIPDERRPGFQDEVDRQCTAMNRSPNEQEALKFIEHAMDYLGWV